MTESTPIKKSLIDPKNPMSNQYECSDEEDNPDRWIDGDGEKTKVPPSQEFNNIENEDLIGTKDLIIDEKNVVTSPLMNPFGNSHSKIKSKKKQSSKNKISKKKPSAMSNPQTGYIDGLAGEEDDEENDRSDIEPASGGHKFDRGNGTLIKIEELDNTKNNVNKLTSSERVMNIHPIK